MANEIRVEKCFYDLNEYMDYSGFLTQAEVPYLVFGVEEELAALNAVREASPETLENLTRQTLEISERINQDIFKVLVTYEMDVKWCHRCRPGLHCAGPGRRRDSEESNPLPKDQWEMFR